MMSAKIASSRRQKAFIGAWNTLLLDRRNPYIIAWWSITFAGLGHILMDRYIRGFILVSGEILLNLASHLNLAIYYIIGQFNKAKEVLDVRWFLLYMAIYGFSIIDSYREAVNINNIYILAAREDTEIQPFAINSSTFSHLNSVPPALAMLCSAMLPGSGCFLLQRMNRALYLILLWIIITYFSNIFPALLNTLEGQIDLTKSCLDIQWFLNIPSIWFFSIYEAYACAVENNKLFRWELTKHLKNEYQSKQFMKEAPASMYLYSIFEHSIKIESAITALQMKGITKESILAVPLDRRNENRLLFDTVNSSDSTSMLALSMVLAVICSLFGSIFGYNLAWGPVIWAFIGAVSGAIIGFGISLAISLTHKKHHNSEMKAGVIVVVRCTFEQSEMVQDILWNNAAMGVSTLSI